MLSQNGWPANNPDYIATYTIPGTSQKVPLRRGDVATVLMYVAGRFHREVEPIHKGWCWGYAERTIRGGVALSNHASGTAIDLNAPAHPLGTSPSSTFSAAEIRKIHEIVKACGGVVRWGGDYTGRKDAMHFEIVGNTSQVAALAARLRKPSTGKPSTTLPSWYTRVLRQGNTGRDVAHVQAVVKVAADGKFGPNTKSHVISWQRSHGLTADGIVGPATARKMG